MKRKKERNDWRACKSKKLDATILWTVEYTFWALVFPYLCIKDLLKMQSVCKYFDELVHTPAIWDSYFSIRGLKFSSPELRRTILKSCYSCFMYTRMFVASDVLQKFLNEECVHDNGTVYESSFPRFISDGWDVYHTELVFYSWNLFKTRIVKVDPVSWNIDMENKLIEDYKRVLEVIVETQPEYSHLLDSQEGIIDLDGVKTPNQYFAWYQNWFKKLENLHHIGYAHSQIAIDIEIRSCHITSIKPELGYEGQIILGGFWERISPKLVDGTVEWHESFLKMSDLFSWLVDDVRDDFFYSNGDNPDDTFDHYVKSTFTRLIDECESNY